MGSKASVLHQEKLETRIKGLFTPSAERNIFISIAPFTPSDAVPIFEVATLVAIILIDLKRVKKLLKYLGKGVLQLEKLHLCDLFIIF